MPPVAAECALFALDHVASGKGPRFAVWLYSREPVQIVAEVLRLHWTPYIYAGSLNDRLHEAYRAKYATSPYLAPMISACVPIAGVLDQSSAPRRSQDQ